MASLEKHCLDCDTIINKYQKLVTNINGFKLDNANKSAQAKHELSYIVHVLEILTQDTHTMFQKLNHELKSLNNKLKIIDKHRQYWEEEVEANLLQADLENFEYYKKHEAKIHEDAEKNMYRSEERKTKIAVDNTNASLVTPDKTKLYTKKEFIVDWSEKKHDIKVSANKGKAISKQTTYLGLGLMLERKRQVEENARRKKKFKNLGLVYPPRVYTSSDDNDESFDDCSSDSGVN